jgi:hypothetical protein
MPESATDEQPSPTSTAAAAAIDLNDDKRRAAI